MRQGQSGQPGVGFGSRDRQTVVILSQRVRPVERSKGSIPMLNKQLPRRSLCDVPVWTRIGGKSTLFIKYNLR